MSSTIFCHFSGNFIISSSQNFLSFWTKNCSRCLWQSSRELNFFPLKEFCKDQNKGKFEGAISGEYRGSIRTFHPSYKQFLPDHQRNMGSCIILMEDYIFSVDLFWTLFIESCFRLISWGAVLVGINPLVFQKKLIMEDSQSHPNTRLLSLNEDHPLMWLVGGGSFRLAHNLFCSTSLCLFITYHNLF